MNHHRLLLACMPKSGSTYLRTIIANLPNFSHVSLVTTYGKREQEIEPSLILLNEGKSFIAQHHVRLSEATRSLTETYNLKTIVLVRNIFDIVISFRDHIRNESVVFPMAYAFPDCKTWKDAKLEEFIADLIVPWYFNFYVSWLEIDEKILVTYEDLNRDPYAVLSSIKTRYRIACSDSDIEAAISKSQYLETLKNVAVIGRGQRLSENARQHILRLAHYYDDVDFKSIGIGSQN